jgi:hypothetical protein
MTDERRADKRFLLHTWVQITGIDKSGRQFMERSRLEDIGDNGCRFSLQGAVHEGSIIGVMPLGQDGESLVDEFRRLFVVIWIKRKGKCVTVGARSLREDELSDGGSQTSFSTSKIYAK